jgi:hypothetical protein
MLNFTFWLHLRSNCVRGSDERTLQLWRTALKAFDISSALQLVKHCAQRIFG